MIVHESLDLWLSIAERTGRTLPDWKCLEFHIKRIVNQKLTNQRLPFFENQFNGFCRLNQSNLPGHNSQDTCFVSGGDETGRRRFREEAP
jgi:hypothetical protein